MSILRTSLTRRTRPYPNWKMGQKLVGVGVSTTAFSGTARSSRRRRPLSAATSPSSTGNSRRASVGSSQRERFSSDIPDSVYGLHSQAVVWQGLRWMGLVWAETGDAALAATCRRLADRLGRGPRGGGARVAGQASGRLAVPPLPAARPGTAVRRPDGIAAPAATGTSSSLTRSRLACFAPEAPRPAGALRYLRLHGSRFLGLVRAGAYALYGHAAPYPDLWHRPGLRRSTSRGSSPRSTSRTSSCSASTASWRRR